MRSQVPDLVLKIGSVDTSYDGLGCYVVNTAGGRYFCQAGGDITGRLGVSGGALYFPHQMVLIAVDAHGTARTGVIICGIELNRPDPFLSGDAQPTLVYPQVSGYRFGGDWLGSLAASPLSAPLLERAAMMRRSIPPDSVAGDWLQLSRFGAGVGVEAFRAWLTGGAMCGVWAYADEQRLRLAALELETITPKQETIERMRPSGVEHIGKEVLYPEEAIDDADARLLRLSGPMHGGWSKYLGPAKQEVVATSGTDAAPVSRIRQALFHEHLAVDGSYTLTSAANIILRRTISVEMPEHRVTPPDYTPVTTAAETRKKTKSSSGKESIKVGAQVAADTELPDQPKSTLTDISKVVELPRGFPQIAFDSSRTPAQNDPNPILAYVRRVRDIGNLYSNWLARNAVDQLPMEWERRPFDPRMVGVQADSPLLNRVWLKARPAPEVQNDGTTQVRTSTGNSFVSLAVDLNTKERQPLVPTANGTSLYEHISLTPGQWAALPRTITIQIDRHVGSRKFYVGSSVVAILEDGSVVIEDANRASVTLAGGCALVSAPKDVIYAAGRDITFIAGRHLTMRAHDTVTLASNAGQVLVKAEEDVQVLAGNSGKGGLLLESRGQIDGAVPNGVSLRSRTQAQVAAPVVGIAGISLAAAGYDTSKPGDGRMDEGQVLVQADAVAHVRINQQDANYAFGRSFTASWKELGPNLSSTYRTAEIGATSSTFFAIQSDTQLCVQSSDSAHWKVGNDVGTVTDTAWSNLRQIYPQLDPGLVSGYGFHFPSSADLGITNPEDFQIPEASWQAHAKFLPVSYPRWSESIVYGPAGDPGAPYPGYAAWCVENRFYQASETAFLDPLTGLIKPEVLHVGQTDATNLPPGQLNPINQTFLRGYFQQPQSSPVT